MPGADEAQLVALARRHQDQLLAIRDRTVTVMERLWARFGVDPSSDALDRFLAVAVQPLEGATAAAASAALAYMPTYVAAATGTAPRDPIVLEQRWVTPRGLASVEVLTKPFVSMRVALSEGKSLASARESGRQRLVQIAATDPMLAARAAGSAAMKAEPRIVGYRRVTDGNACSFCRLAATQRYGTEELMGLHVHCGCTVAPIVGEKDPGRVIDRNELRRLKADGVVDEISLRRYIADTDRVVEDYRARAAHWREQARTTPDQEAETRYAKRADNWAAKADKRAGQVDRAREQLKVIRSGRLERLTAVHDHGELGPVLYPAGVQFEAL
jgi:hypothetical protein